MKNLFVFSTLILLLHNVTFAQQIITEQSQEPVFFKVKSHDPNITEFPVKSFYESKSDWQFIIDTTWGPGLPLAQKLEIFNAYAANLEEKFDGFEPLGFIPATYDTLKYHYFSQIDSTTSKGRFSAIMYYFAMNLSDGHTYAFNKEVAYTALNPGIPVLVLGGFSSVEHFGAVLTVLEDSTALVLRVVENHPLNLEPGDIILGYEGVLWKDLVQELLEAELPAFGGSEFWWFGGTAGSPSSFNSAIHISAGMNWHLFNTIDILKYSTGDTLHLSVAPLLQLNLPPMLNNEQLEISNIPFPTYFNGEMVTYGILDNTNIGYINVFSEDASVNSDQQFNNAVIALKETDGLIIDMRWNEGGYAFWQNAFDILNNETKCTLEWTLRCNPANFLLCPDGDTLLATVSGLAPDLYERPIAVLVGPTCISMGDINAYRLKYLSTVRVFGKPTVASMGYSERIQSFTDWQLRYSIADIFHINSPNNYLNRKELPIDIPIWITPADVANGYDTVVEEALGWINNLVFAHDLKTDKEYYIPGTDSIVINAQIENPNSHQASMVTYIKDLQGSLIDSVLLNPSGDSQSELWTGVWDTPIQEEFFKLDITAKDLVTSESFTLTNVGRFTTAGPVVLDSVSFTKTPTNYLVKTFLRNESTNTTITNASVKLICYDSWVLPFTPDIRDLPDIPPGGVVKNSLSFGVYYIDSLFPGYFNFKVEVMSDGWTYWTDSMKVMITGVENEVNELPTEFALSQNYPNPFNPNTTIKYSVPELSFVTIKIYDVLGSEVAALVNEEKPVGTYELTWNANNLPSGIYFYQLSTTGGAGDYINTKKMVLLK